MKTDPWRLPWQEQTVPHAVLDICRGCNITCRACYNSAPAEFRPLPDIAADLDRMLSLRRLSSVTIVGGEVTLHPELCRIVSLAKQRRLNVEICTNGVLLDNDYAARLKAAGTDIIYLHIETGQDRPDLAEPASPAAVRALREDKARLAHAHGLDAGLLVTVFSATSPEILEAIRTTLESPHLNYLLVTLFRDVAAIATISGALDTGMQGQLARPYAKQPDTDRGNRQAADMVLQQLGLRPFGYIGSNTDSKDPRWLSYLVGTACRRDGTTCWHDVKPSLFERCFLWLSLALAGRYPMYQAQSPGRFRVQLLANALMGGRLRANLKFLATSCHDRADLRAKRLLFQNPAFVDVNGRVVHCNPCADAVMKAGRLVPVCISDRVANDADRPAGRAT
jgi:hypothetical protein